jgi:hypothetical protein
VLRHVGGVNHPKKYTEEGHDAVDTSGAKGVGNKRRLATTQCKHARAKVAQKAKVAHLAEVMASPPATAPVGTPATAVPPGLAPGATIAMAAL